VRRAVVDTEFVQPRGTHGDHPTLEVREVPLHPGGSCENPTSAERLFVHALLAVLHSANLMA
jgi:hypothetical protein